MSYVVHLYFCFISSFVEMLISGKAPPLVASMILAILLLLIGCGTLASPSVTNRTLSKLCGTYRSYPYVGIQCQYPNSPSMGLLWYQPSQVSATSSSLSSLLRHEANHDDHLLRFGWNQHDGAGFGRQELVDPQNHVNLTVQWVHLNDDSQQSDKNSTASSWVLRVMGESILENDATTTTTTTTDLSLLWYVGTPGSLTVRYDPWNGGIIQGHKYQTCLTPSKDTVYASYYDNQTNSSKMYNATYFAAFQVPLSNVFDPKPTILQELRNPTSSLPPHLFDPSSLYRAETALVGNQIVQQLFLTTPFQVDVHLNLLLSLQSSNNGALDNVPSQCHSSWDSTTASIDTARRRFQERFGDVFLSHHHHKSHTNKDELSLARRHLSVQEWTKEQIEMAQYALGNMLSSISYMHGASQIYDNVTQSVTWGPVTSGWTIVPDRPDHAQGYLWDDGFHQQLVHHWDMEWTMEILRSWYDEADDQGWIPRQMILGDEARWSARPSSWAQIPGSANPPSHIWILQSLLRYQQRNKLLLSDKFKDFLRSIWHPLERNLQWYLRTQASEIPGFFRWQGRTTEYCLPSGMDDYPRAPMLTKREAHLDLHCWMIASCRAVSKVATALGMHEKATFYEQKRSKLTNSLLGSFWDDETGVFDDFYMDEDDNKIFVRHLGYLNFFPVFLDVLPTNSTLFEHLLLKLLDRDNGLWTEFGLRSLSKKDPYFMKGDSYWTGLLWLNINYLAVSTLHGYSHSTEGPIRESVQEAYTDLRRGLMKLVVDQFVETGFIWEVYDAISGKGRDNHPFTGWSALIVNIMAELY